MLSQWKRLTLYGSLAAALAVIAPAADEVKKDEVKKKDRYDKAGETTEKGLNKAGNATNKAADKAGDAGEKALDATGKGVGAAVEHTSRTAVKGAKATAGAVEGAGEKIADLFTDNDNSDKDRHMERVKETQQALKSKGYYGGPVDGRVNGATVSGLREYQRDNNLKVTGKVDKQTAEKLGLQP